MSYYFGCGLFVGVVGTFLVMALFSVPASQSRYEAQTAYTRCVTDGAPKDRCIETYLLPEERK